MTTDNKNFRKYWKGKRERPSNFLEEPISFIYNVENFNEESIIKMVVIIYESTSQKKHKIYIGVLQTAVKVERGHSWTRTTSQFV